jgi:hypothetical protein
VPEVFAHGLTCREEVNVLAALDRAVPTADPLWAKFFITSLVEFVVWTTRPTGYVDSARWLVTALCRWTGRPRTHTVPL